MSDIQTVNSGIEERKSYGTTLLLCFFGGALGLHRIYTGYTVIGILQLLTGGGWGIWTLVDMISLWLNKFKDANSNDLEGYDTVCVFLTVFAYLLILVAALMWLLKRGF